MAATNIIWAEEVWNPISGCDQISRGCSHCYAMAMAKRLKAMRSKKYQTDGDPRTSGPGFGVAFHPYLIEVPLHWRKPRRVFVNSMSDVGHPRIPRPFLARMWSVMALAHRNDFLVLTKRPKRVQSILSSEAFAHEVAEHAAEMVAANPHLPGTRHALQGWRCESEHTPGQNLWLPPWPLPNVWVGTSIESDEYSWRADELRETNAAVKFLSLEPLLGPLPSLNLTGIDWVIAGGESGIDYRPVELKWLRDIRDRCQQESVPFLLKQIGGLTPMAAGRTLDGRTWDQFPNARAHPDPTGSTKHVGSAAHA